MQLVFTIRTLVKNIVHPLLKNDLMKLMESFKLYRYYKLNAVCSGSIVVTTLDCGPGGPWFKSRVGANIL